jgi:PAS domain S-box-containing protein
MNKKDNMDSPLRLLLIDDNPDDRVLTLRELKKEFEIQVREIIDAEGLASALKEGDFDIVITDYQLKWSNGLEILAKIKARYPDCPVIMFTGTGNEQIAVEAVKDGLDDYVIKSPKHFKRLPAAVKVAIKKAKERQTIRETQEALRESEEKFRTLVERANDGITIIRDTIVRYVNPCLAEMWGGTVDEIIGTPFVDYVHPDDRAKVVERYKRRMAGEDVIPIYEAVLRRKDGSKVYAELNTGITTYEGRPANLVIVRDITERKQAEEALSYSKDKLQILQQITATVHSTLEKEKVFNQIADGIVYSLGYTAALITLLNDEKNCFEVQTFSTQKRLVTQIDKVLGFPLKKFSFSAASVPNDAIGTVLKGKMVVTKNLAEIAYPLISKRACSIIQALRGSKNYIVAPLRITDEVVGGLMISSEREEITAEELQLVETFAYAASQAITNASLHMETKRAADALRESEEKYRELVENLNDVIYMLDIDGIVTYISPVVEAVTGFSLKEVVGRPFTDFVYEEDLPLIMNRFQEVMSGHLEPTEYRLIDKSGQIRWVRSSSRPIVEDNRVIGLRGIFLDITARKQAEEKIKASLREKEVLLKEVHHRVKNNMQVISSMLSLQSHHTTDKASRMMFQESQNRIRAMALIHEKLYTSEDLAHIDIAGYIHSLTHQLITSYRTTASRVNMDIAVTDIFLTITTAIPCGLIINELVTNALKHAFPHQRDGTITVSMTPSTNDHLILTVSDTGIGFPEGIDFRNTTTLGMQLVTSLVEQLEGTITLDRSEGTRFRIEFRTQE